jgi:hypothetical protein
MSRRVLFWFLLPLDFSKGLISGLMEQMSRKLLVTSFRSRPFGQIHPVDAFRESIATSGELQKNGDFVAALKLRKIAFANLDCSGRFKRLQKKGIRDLAWLQIEQQKHEKWLNLGQLEILYSFIISPRSTLLALKQYRTLQEMIHSFLSRKCSSKNYLFLRKILGFTEGELIKVALVGSGKIESELGYIIESHDLVMRVGIRDLEHTGDTNFYGKKTNMIFLNGNQSALISAEKLTEYRQKKIFLAHRGGVKGLRSSGFQWEVENLDYLFSVSSLLTGMRSLTEILRLGNIVVDVYGMDFYSSEASPWFHGYRNNKETEEVNSIENRAGHDLLTSLGFASYLAKFGSERIRFFDSYGNLMSLDMNGYAELMTKRFRKRPLVE